MSPHLTLLNVQLNHIVMVPQSLCGLRVSGLGRSLVGPICSGVRRRLSLRSLDSGARLQPSSGIHPNSIPAQIAIGFII